MAQYQQYHKFRPKTEEKGFKFAKILIILAIFLVVYLIGRAIFGSSGEVESILPEGNVNSNVNTEANSNENNNINSDLSVNKNTNENLNENANSNVNIDMSGAESFELSGCDRVYSRGNAGEKKVSLTFNVGTAKEGSVQSVLDTLTSSGTPADFFARGDVAEENPELVKKISTAGFSVYNLSYSHPYFSDLPESGMIEQLTEAEAAISLVTGRTTKPFFRPPYGDADEDVVSAVTEAGYCPITWSIDAMDWSSDYTAEQSKARVLDNIASGSIVLMQAGNSVTAEILPGLISELELRGYQIAELKDIL